MTFQKNVMPRHTNYSLKCFYIWQIYHSTQSIRFPNLPQITTSMLMIRNFICLFLLIISLPISLILKILFLLWMIGCLLIFSHLTLIRLNFSWLNRSSYKQLSKLIDHPIHYHFLTMSHFLQLNLLVILASYLILIFILLITYLLILNLVYITSVTSNVSEVPLISLLLV